MKLKPAYSQYISLMIKLLIIDVDINGHLIL